jgi:hypothetical protein
MAFRGIGESGGLRLGSLLQIVFSNGVRNQISTDYRDFEMVKRAKVGSSVARELRFSFQSSLGPAAIQYRNPGESGRAFPSAHQVSLQEYTAQFKELNATIELEYNLYDRARKSPEKYAQPLAIEIDSKMSAAKRRIAADLYGDGTGVVGTVASAAVTSPASDRIVFTLGAARGHVGFFEYEDILVLKSAAGNAPLLDLDGVAAEAQAPALWRVIDKDRAAGTVTLQALTAGLTSFGTIAALTGDSKVPPTAGDVFYRYGQPTFPNLTSIADYGTASEVMAGLESLAAADGRRVHGIEMLGATGASRVDVAGAALDVTHIERVMNQVKLRVGQDRYRWKMMVMAPEAQSALINSRETDRRFQSVEDNKRGIKMFAYIHRNDVLECVDSEYVPQNRIWVLPETKAGEKVIEFHGSDFETVKGEDMSDFHLKPGAGGGFQSTMASYLQAVGVIVCKHPAAIARLENFTV